jgi:hypothetical protein
MDKFNEMTFLIARVQALAREASIASQTRSLYDVVFADILSFASREDTIDDIASCLKAFVESRRKHLSEGRLSQNQFNRDIYVSEMINAVRVDGTCEFRRMHRRDED